MPQLTISCQEKNHIAKFLQLAYYLGNFNNLEYILMFAINYSQEKMPSLEDSKNYIYSIDFSMIIDKMVMTGWSRKIAEGLSQEYKNFLYLNRKYLNQFGQLPPSEEIDEFWHNHILDTKKYAVDCQKIFGFYLDHYPYFGIDDKSNYNDLNNAFERVEKLYFEEFGKEMPKITDRFSLIIMSIKRLFAFW